MPPGRQTFHSIAVQHPMSAYLYVERGRERCYTRQGYDWPGRSFIVFQNGDGQTQRNRQRQQGRYEEIWGKRPNIWEHLRETKRFLIQIWNVSVHFPCNFRQILLHSSVVGFSGKAWRKPKCFTSKSGLSGKRWWNEQNQFWNGSN